MAPVDVQSFLRLTPQLLRMPFRNIWSSYDQEVDTLYITFKKPSHADDSYLTDDDIIVRTEAGNPVGVTILHASSRTL
ncbi:MAG: DUF2283 domain-containing protein [Candidatus Margulisiibacteriota bacterium]